MSTNVYEVSLEGNDIDISGDIEQVLSNYLTNHQNKVSVSLLRTDCIEEED